MLREARSSMAGMSGKAAKRARSFDRRKLRSVIGAQTPSDHAPSVDPLRSVLGSLGMADPERRG
jgi:hypothetical protein